MPHPYRLIRGNLARRGPRWPPCRPPGDTLVVGVDGQGNGGELVELLQRGDVGQLCKAAQQHAVGGRLAGKDLPRLGHELFCHLGRVLGLRVGGLRVEWFLAGDLRVCIGNEVGEALAAEDHDGAIVFHRSHGDLHPLDRDRLQQLAQLRAFFRGDAARAPVGDGPRRIQGGEVQRAATSPAFMGAATPVAAPMKAGDVAARLNFATSMPPAPFPTGARRIPTEKCASFCRAAEGRLQ